VGQKYTSTTFILPLTVTVHASLASPPSTESRHLLSWDAVDSATNKVRFLAPVAVYRPPGQTPTAVPKDYVAYLRELTQRGAHVDDVTTTTVDGRPATLLTVTSDADLNGSLGCPETNSDQENDCFGVQTDLVLRMAVVDVDGTTFLAWARQGKDHPDAAFTRNFEGMLKTLHFQ
jgi:hypothetical protein